MEAYNHVNRYSYEYSECISIFIILKNSIISIWKLLGNIYHPIYFISWHIVLIFDGGKKESPFLFISPNNSIFLQIKRILTLKYFAISWSKSEASFLWRKNVLSWYFFQNNYWSVNEVLFQKIISEIYGSIKNCRDVEIRPINPSMCNQITKDDASAKPI